RRHWDWSSTNATVVEHPDNIALNGTPVFLSEHFSILPIKDKPITTPPVSKDFTVNVFPNPASANASISFSLKSSARVTVTIYNTEGRLITTAIAGRSYSGGTYTVPLPIQQLASGVYYCHFSTEKSEEMKKLVIAR
ncbi:MAG TPA: T9SS type A sorting domain-containing protein, partial [Niastella sp.]|nr:T9SS type A sorting domain-containing protein [Niastella sp.]